MISEILKIIETILNAFRHFDDKHHKPEIKKMKVGKMLLDIYKSNSALIEEGKKFIYVIDNGHSNPYELHSIMKNMQNQTDTILKLVNDKSLNPIIKIFFEEIEILIGLSQGRMRRAHYFLDSLISNEKDAEHLESAQKMAQYGVGSVRNFSLENQDYYGYPYVSGSVNETDEFEKLLNRNIEFNKELKELIKDNFRFEELF